MKKLLSVFFLILIVVSMLLSFSVNVLAAAENTSLLNSITKETNSETIVNKIDNSLGFIVFKLCPMIGILLTAISGVILGTGSAHGHTKVIKALIGVGIVVFSPALVGLIIGFYK